MCFSMDDRGKNSNGSNIFPTGYEREKKIAKFIGKFSRNPQIQDLKSYAYLRFYETVFLHCWK